MKRSVLLAVILFAAACRGSVPERSAPPEQAISAILISCKTILPSGETRNGKITINFDSEGGRQGEVYRLPLTSGDNYLYLIEPGLYRIAPTRSLFGFYQPMMNVVIEGRTYTLPFPRELLRQHAYEIKPGKITSMGSLEATVMPALPGQKPTVRVRLDDSTQARRSVVQTTIRDMMDPRKPVEVREAAFAWSRALQNSLMELLAEEQQRPLYKPAQ
jgi:hypothetical protein